MFRIEAEPHGAWATCTFLSPPISTMQWEGKNGAKCFLTPIGPMPGPPPPWGMAKVLCKLRWQTSAPIKPGAV